MFDTVEFYVIAAFVAAAVVALLSRPKGLGPIKTLLLAGELSAGDGDTAPSIELTCRDDGTVELRRHGVEGINETGAVSLAVSIKGFDISIEERQAAGRDPLAPMIDTATFVIEDLGPERYHVRYNSESAGLVCALTLHVRPGIHTVKALQ